MNAPPKFEGFKCIKGERKITVTIDRKVQNASIFTINKADHTIGNLLREQLFKDPRVLFAGYKMPHPLEYNIVIRVQTAENYSPQEAFIAALRELIKRVSRIEELFREDLMHFQGSDDC
ncbi:DNA-directed RNA polymerase II subunit RPB11-a-like [Scaptodrosophila lebanonensis]|uniref:DNA-directed RNA polymerase II subunit RPB11-a-like n=1 Tax=Drosophila lebanonensis TaxID=7225 RepID=A0A6J2U6E9_DROLE|nr:DNA-directed RNA polymerase II subunit RPB11-a-like [Scaptodrosophila lebanonensis]